MLPGSSKKSMHLLGKAIDVAMEKSSQEDFIKIARRVGFTGIGRYKTFVHIDTGMVREWGDPAMPHKDQDKAS